MENRIRLIDKAFERTINKKNIHEGILLVENSKGDFSYSREYGDKGLDTPILMASITKLLTTTCIFILQEQGQLSLDDKVATYVQGDIVSNLHLYKGWNYSEDLTLSHLLFQTSGLPDISEEGVAVLRKHVIYKDMHIDFDKIIRMTKQQTPHFAPGFKNRAHYADVNFDLLGNVIEIITQSTLNEAYKQFIFEPLGLIHTYLPENEHDFIPEVYYHDNSLYRPDIVRSCRASGGVISTARELMMFIKAFFGGKLFNKAIFNEQNETNKLQFSMFPIRYSAGYMFIPLTGLANLFMGKGELIGHSGSTGSLAFYYPRQDLFFVGDVNQMSNPALPMRLAMQIAISMKS